MIVSRVIYNEADRQNALLLRGGIVFVADFAYAYFETVFAKGDVLLLHLLASAIGEFIRPEVELEICQLDVLECAVVSRLR